MADKTYKALIGQVQKFKDSPVVEEKEANGSLVREFTIKSFDTGKLAKVTLWPNTAVGAVIEEGALVSGTFAVSQNGKYINLTAYSLTVQNPETNAEREVVRKNTAKPATETDEDEVDF